MLSAPFLVSPFIADLVLHTDMAARQAPLGAAWLLETLGAARDCAFAACFELVLASPHDHDFPVFSPCHSPLTRGQRQAARRRGRSRSWSWRLSTTHRQLSRLPLLRHHSCPRQKIRAHVRARQGGRGGGRQVHSEKVMCQSRALRKTTRRTSIMEHGVP
ncbi:MAG: hypothetical protein ACPIOQ_43945 [Promethearchaeia archaeon]